jgi:translation initiation factor 2A
LLCSLAAQVSKAAAKNAKKRAAKKKGDGDKGEEEEGQEQQQQQQVAAATASLAAATVQVWCAPSSACIGWLASCLLEGGGGGGGGEVTSTGPCCLPLLATRRGLGDARAEQAAAAARGTTHAAHRAPRTATQRSVPLLRQASRPAPLCPAHHPLSPQGAASAGGEGGAAEAEKRARNLQKRLRQISQLREKQAAGSTLEAEQLAKLASEAAVLEELRSLGFEP